MFNKNFTKEDLFFYYYDNKEFRNEDYSLKLIELANLPVNTTVEFGDKMVIALTAIKPSRFFLETKKNKQLAKYFPELFNACNCLQDPKYHTDNVFEHTMKALDQVENVSHQNLYSLKDILPYLLDIKLAVLFHDLGKVQTRKEMID